LKVIWRLTPVIGMLAALAPALTLVLAPTLARAQTNLDQGKSAAQIFAADCAECHKAPQGLAKGKNAAAVTDFLHEHYTTSRQQAAALAAYVLGGRGGEPIGGTAQGRGQKPAAEHASASAEDPKPAKHQAKPSAKPEEETPANAKLRRPGHEPAKPKDEANRGEQPSIVGPEGGQHDNRAATGGRNHRKEPKSPEHPQEPAAVAPAPAAAVAAPAPTETPSQETSPGITPSAAAPADGASGDAGDNAPVPRDNIPD
jgi:hypothetical protein